MAYQTFRRDWPGNCRTRKAHGCMPQLPQLKPYVLHVAEIFDCLGAESHRRSFSASSLLYCLLSVSYSADENPKRQLMTAIRSPPWNERKWNLSVPQSGPNLMDRGAIRIDSKTSNQHLVEHSQHRHRKHDHDRASAHRLRMIEQSAHIVPITTRIALPLWVSICVNQCLCCDQLVWSDTMIPISFVLQHEGSAWHWMTNSSSNEFLRVVMIH